MAPRESKCRVHRNKHTHLRCMLFVAQTRVQALAWTAKRNRKQKAADPHHGLGNPMRAPGVPSELELELARSLDCLSATRHLHGLWRLLRGHRVKLFASARVQCRPSAS